MGSKIKVAARQYRTPCWAHFGLLDCSVSLKASWGALFTGWSRLGLLASILHAKEISVSRCPDVCRDTKVRSHKRCLDFLAKAPVEECDNAQAPSQTNFHMKAVDIASTDCAEHCKRGCPKQGAQKLTLLSTDVLGLGVEAAVDTVVKLAVLGAATIVCGSTFAW